MISTEFKYVMNVNPPDDVQPAKEEMTRALGNQQYDNAPKSDNKNTGTLPIFDLKPPPLPDIFGDNQIPNIPYDEVKNLFGPTDISNAISAIGIIDVEMLARIEELKQLLPDPTAAIAQVKAEAESMIADILSNFP